MIKIALFGSTGSIGTQVLNVVNRYPNLYKIISLTANDNAKELEKQINIYKPRVAVITNPEKVNQIKEVGDTTLYFGQNSLEHALLEDADIVFVALSGFVGYKIVYSALSMNKRVALANKESLVSGGELITKIGKGELIPVDSEHSAIWQCLNFNRDKEFKHLLLTASGGAFRAMTKQEIAEMPASKALNHPNWKMGKKITVDCATMMNKGLEVIEAKWLFNTSLDKIKVVVHPQSIIHSMVAFKDGVTMAQLSYPTMEIPIQLALTYPNRLETGTADYDFYGKSLTFEELDTVKFPCFKLALDSAKAGGNMPCAMNGANEQAVKMYLEGKIKFYDLSNAIDHVLQKTIKISQLSTQVLLETDLKSRALVKEFFGDI